MYSKIVNPYNGKLENINSLFGKQILSNYLHILNGRSNKNFESQRGGSVPQGKLQSWGPTPEEIVQTPEEIVQIDADIVQAAQSQAPDIICAITHDIILDPVVTGDGFTYERSAIEKWFGRGVLTSPLTGVQLDNTDLIPNIALKHRIDDWIEENGYTEYWKRRNDELKLAQERESDEGWSVLARSRHSLTQAENDQVAFTTQRSQEIPLQPDDVVRILGRPTVGSIDGHGILAGHTFPSRHIHEGSWFSNQPPSRWIITDVTTANHDELLLNWIKWRLLDPVPWMRRVDDARFVDDSGSLDDFINNIPVRWPQYLDELQPMMDDAQWRNYPEVERDVSFGDMPNSLLLLQGQEWWVDSEPMAQSIVRLDIRLQREALNRESYEELIRIVLADDRFSRRAPLMLEDGDPVADIPPPLQPPIDGDEAFFELENRDFMEWERNLPAATAIAVENREAIRQSEQRAVAGEEADASCSIS